MELICPDDDNLLKIYRFYFSSLERPIEIMSVTKIEAKLQLLQIVHAFVLKDLVQITVALPVFGVSKKYVNGICYVWVADRTPTGWIELDKFKS